MRASTCNPSAWMFFDFYRITPTDRTRGGNMQITPGTKNAARHRSCPQAPVSNAARRGRDCPRAVPAEQAPNFRRRGDQHRDAQGGKSPQMRDHRQAAASARRLREAVTTAQRRCDVEQDHHLVAAPVVREPARGRKGAEGDETAEGERQKLGIRLIPFAPRSPPPRVGRPAWRGGRAGAPD